MNDMTARALSWTEAGMVPDSIIRGGIRRLLERKRRDINADDPEAAFEVMKAWMDAQPTGIEGRRQMPQFHLTDEQVRDLTEFLLWTNKIRTQDWPPNDAG